MRYLPGMNAPANINHAGEPGSLQRLVWSVPRATTPTEWKECRRLADELLSKAGPDADTVGGLVLNALCCALERVEAARTGESMLIDQVLAD